MVQYRPDRLLVFQVHQRPSEVSTHPGESRRLLRLCRGQGCGQHLRGDLAHVVYASNEADAAHESARALVERLAEGPELVYVFWPTLIGYLRIVTHRAILPRPLTPIDAAANVASLLGRTHVRSPGEGDDFWKLYRRVAGDRSRGNDVPDAHLVTLMHQHGVRVLYSRDRGFRRFDGIEVRDPFG